MEEQQKHEEMKKLKEEEIILRETQARKEREEFERNKQVETEFKKLKKRNKLEENRNLFKKEANIKSEEEQKKLVQEAEGLEKIKLEVQRNLFKEELLEANIKSEKEQRKLLKEEQDNVFASSEDVNKETIEPLFGDTLEESDEHKILEEKINNTKDKNKVSSILTRSKRAISPTKHSPFTKLSQSTPISKKRIKGNKNSATPNYPIVTRRNEVVNLLANVRTRGQKRDAKSFLQQTHFNPSIVSDIIEKSPLLNDLKPSTPPISDQSPGKHKKKKKLKLSGNTSDKEKGVDKKPDEKESSTEHEKMDVE